MANDDELRHDGYLSNKALRDGFKSIVEINETKNDSNTIKKFFQTEMHFY